jgi:transcriptional regulator of nitric oxide reductase
MSRLRVARLTDVRGEEWRILVGRGSLTAMRIQDGEISLVSLPGGTDVD